MVRALQSQQAATSAEIHGLKLERDALTKMVVNLTHENEVLKRRLYGNKTERADTTEAQLTFGNLLEDQSALQDQLDEAAAAALADAQDGDDNQPKPTRRSKGARPDLSKSKLPRVVVDIKDANLEAEGCCIGQDTSYQLMRIPGSVRVLVRNVHKYRIPTNTGSTIKRAQLPKTLFPKSMLHSSAIAWLLVQKFALGTPFYRLEQHLREQDGAVDRATMCRYAEEAGNVLGCTIAQAMWDDACANAAVISTDATGAMIQPEKRNNVRQACVKGHFFTAVADCDHILFAYTPKHDQKTVTKLFGSFGGFLQADASNVYDVLDRGPPGLFDEDDASPTLVGCWTHCRRYFFEAAICKIPAGVEGLARIGAMYRIDNAFKKLPPAKRRKLRNAHLRPQMQAFFEWVEQAKASRERDLGTKAIGYAYNQKAELLRVLDDPKLPLDNTRAERSLRKIVVGRKNWMFYGSDTHAEAAAALFTMIASCRLYRIDPVQFLDDVLRILPYWPKDRYIELAPNRWNDTRAKLLPAELEAPLSTITVPKC